MSIWRSLLHSLTGKSAAEVSAVSLDVDDYLEELLAKAFERNDLNLAIEEGEDVAYLTEVANRGKVDIAKAATEERDALVSIAKVMQRSDEVIKVAMSILKVMPILPFRGLFRVLAEPLYRYWWSSRWTASIRNRLNEAREAYKEALLEQGIIPLLREAISKPSYSKTFVRKPTPGLAEFYDPLYEVRTAAATSLAELLENLPSASIGIGGARGVGKTRILRSFASGRGISTGDGERPPLHLFVNAPVDYAPQDFALHLSVTACEGILGPAGELLTPSRVLGAETSQRHSPTAVASAGLLLSGVFVLVVSLTGFKLNPGLTWGVCLTVAGIVGLIWWLSSGIAAVEVVLSTFGVSLELTRREISPEFEIEEKALRWLRAVRYQQAAAAARTGSTKSPVGIEAGRTTTTTTQHKH